MYSKAHREHYTGLLSQGVPPNNMFMQDPVGLKCRTPQNIEMGGGTSEGQRYLGIVDRGSCMYRSWDLTCPPFQRTIMCIVHEERQVHSSTT